MRVPLAALSFLCCVFSSVIFPATGKPLQSDSPGVVFAVPGEDVVLPCHSTPRFPPSRVKAAEWLRVDGPALLTVHVERDGEELVKEKEPKYMGRTAAMDDGSLKLLGVTRQDSGTYRCVLLRGAATEEGVLVSLIVGEVPEVSVTLQRTPANDLSVRCESSGWVVKPRVSLLDARRMELCAHTEAPLGPDDLYSVRAQVDAAAAKETGSLICRVEIPGTSVRKETWIFITDEFLPPEPDLRSYVLSVVVLVAVVLLLFILALVVFVVPTEMIEKLRTSLLRTIAQCRHVSTVDMLSIKEYGDITQVSTTGYSRQVSIKGQHLTGVDASHELAKMDLRAVNEYKEKLISVGNKLHVHPAVIAAIISRQSKFGAMLKVDGYGQTDGNSFGLMQINRHYHAVKGSPYSEEHLDQGVTFLVQLIKTMERNKKSWTKEQRLKGALACYICGEEKVLPLTSEELDRVPPCGDFANDVVARAQWFAQNAF